LTPRYRKLRLFLLLFVALGLAPGTWVRGGPRVPDERQLLYVGKLDVPRDAIGPGIGEAIEVAGAWHLRSPNFHFFGFSALLVMGDGTLLALSDHRRQMRFTAPNAARPSAKFDFFTHDPTRHRWVDLEAVTRDPVSGFIWGAYEDTNHIERYHAGLSTGRARPRAMRDWPGNRGAEAMTRLADGRFVVLSEGSPGWFAADLPGVVFAGDPIEGAEARSFRFSPPRDFVPVDMATLPDGRVLILLRAVRWGLPPSFEGMLVVADPGEIRPGERWAWRKVAQLTEPLPMDNYEALAVERGEDGKLVLWLMSDDNDATFQRTLLIKLLWRPNEKARGSLRAPR
jgi:hypothetical protein